MRDFLINAACALLAIAALNACSAGDDEQCRSYGAKPGDQGYVDCMTRLSVMHHEDLQKWR